MTQKALFDRRNQAQKAKHPPISANAAITYQTSVFMAETYQIGRRSSTILLSLKGKHGGGPEIGWLDRIAYKSNLNAPGVNFTNVLLD